MRLLQVVTTDSRLLDLHPQVSVVADVDAATRAHLTAVVRALARQQAVGQGLVEAHGILFDLEPELLGLLAPGRADVDPVIRASDLPGVEVAGGSLVRAREAFADVLERLAAAVGAREAREDELEAAAAARARAAEAVAEAAAALDAAQQGAHDRQAAERAATEGAGAPVAEAEAAARRADEAIEAAESDVAAAARELAEADARLAEAAATVTRLAAEREALRLEEQQAAERLDEASEEDLGSARAALTAIEADLAQAGRSDPAPDRGGVAASGEEPERDLDEAPTRAALVARLAVLDELLDELGELDGAVVAEALEDLRAESPLVSSAEAAALAEQLEGVEAEIADVEAAGPPEVDAADAAAATERLQRARAALTDAEDAARSHAVDPADAAALEGAHEALHDALERSEARVTGRRARAQVDRLRAEEQAILDRLGFLSFAEYLMGTGAAHRDAAAEAALAEARVELAAAEAAADEVEARRAAVLDHAARLDRRRQLLEAAVELMGRPVDGVDDVVGALRDHRVPARSEAAAARELAGALSQVGVDLGDADGLDPEDLALVAEAWLGEAAAVEDRRAELLATRTEVETSLAQLAADDDRVAPSPASSAGAGSSAADDGVRDATEAHELRQARERGLEAVAAAEARVEVHEAARAAVDAAAADRRSVEAALVAAEEEQQLAEVAQLEAREREVQAQQALTSLLAEVAGPASHVEPSEPPPDRGPLEPAPPDAARAALVAAEATLAAAEEAYERARQAEGETARELATLEAEGEVAARRLEVLEDEGRAEIGGTAPDPDELEWYLMARLAAQRSVTVAGSAPLLLEDPFGHLGDDDVHHLLGRLERMAETVQVIVVSDHPAVSAWAAAAGEARAAVVTPIAV